jgi:hypothetical protein
MIAMLAVLVIGAMLPAKPAPIAGLHYLVGGTWKCTYRAGTTSLPYDATYAYDLDGQVLRQVTTFAGGSAEELLAYDAHHALTVVVFDNQGTTTIMHGMAGDPKHFAYRSTYPDTSISDTFDSISATEYTLHATVRSGSKTIHSVDTCLLMP